MLFACSCNSSSNQLSSEIIYNFKIIKYIFLVIISDLLTRLLGLYKEIRSPIPIFFVQPELARAMYNGSEAFYYGPSNRLLYAIPIF